MLIATVAGLLAWGPIGLEGRERRLTDPRVVFGLLNGWTLLLQLPVLLAALAGAWSAGRRGTALSRAWQMFFALVAVAVVASAIDHASSPSAVGYVLSKLPTASACALLSLVFLAERLGRAWVAPRLLWGAVAAGPLGAALCFSAQALTGAPDMRLLLWCEYLPMLLVPLGVWSLRSRGLDGADWLVGLLWFAAAKLLDWADLPIWQASGGGISGHALQHLPLAGCIGWLAWRVALQAGRGSAEAGSSPIANQRAASLTTAG